MKKSRFALSLLLITLASSSWADCTIKLSLCRKMGIRSATSFLESDVASQNDPGQCLQRARAYLDYCASNQQVGAEFSINGILTISAYVSPTSSELWTKSAGGHWIRVQSSY